MQCMICAISISASSRSLSKAFWAELSELHLEVNVHWQMVPPQGCRGAAHQPNHQPTKPSTCQSLRLLAPKQKFRFACSSRLQLYYEVLSGVKQVYTLESWTSPAPTPVRCVRQATAVRGCRSSGKRPEVGWAERDLGFRNLIWSGRYKEIPE